MITFKFDNREISYYDPELDEQLAISLIKDVNCEIGLGLAGDTKTNEEYHSDIDFAWNIPEMPKESLERMHRYINNLIPIDNFFDFICKAEYFDFDKNEFKCTVLIH